jgi:hypothetical protein
MLKVMLFAAAVAAAASPVAAATIVVQGTAGTTGATALYPSALAGNTTGAPASTFLGQPDDTYLGIGNAFVTFDLGLFRVANGTGSDFNVYELDNGANEFNLMDVLVSSDNLVFSSIKLSEAAAINLAGDERHGTPTAANFRRSYDIGTLADVRFIRIQGRGNTGAARTPGGTNGFDLDAIGIANFRPAVPEPATWVMMLGGFGLVGGAMRSARRRKPKATVRLV